MNQPQVTRLPSAAQARLDALQAAEAANKPTVIDVGTLPPAEPTGPVGVVATPPVVAPAAPSAPASEEGVTLTREQFNELQAQAGRAQAAQDRLAELAHRLTELETAAKGTPKPAEPPASAIKTISTEGIAFTPEETEEFKDSREYLTKLVRVTVAEALNPILTELGSQLQEVKQQATTASTAVGAVRQNTFRSELLSKVPDLEQLIRHKHWQAFCESEDPHTGNTYVQLLAAAVNGERVGPAANIYKTFKERYAVGSEQDSQYAGAVPSGNAATPPAPPTTAKLKISDRKKASEDYRMGRITWAKMQEIDKQFEAADKAGNVDYSS